MSPPRRARQLAIALLWCLACGSAQEPQPAEPSPAPAPAVAPDPAPAPSIPPDAPTVPAPPPDPLLAWARALPAQGPLIEGSAVPAAAAKALVRLIGPGPAELTWARAMAPAGALVAFELTSFPSKRDPAQKSVLAVAELVGEVYRLADRHAVEILATSEAGLLSERDVDGDGGADLIVGFMGHTSSEGFDQRIALFASKDRRVGALVYDHSGQPRPDGVEHTSLGLCVARVDGVLLLVNYVDESGPERKRAGTGLELWMRQPDGKFALTPLWGISVANAGSLPAAAKAWQARTGASFVVSRIGTTTAAADCPGAEPLIIAPPEHVEHAPAGQGRRFHLVTGLAATQAAAQARNPGQPVIRIGKQTMPAR